MATLYVRDGQFYVNYTINGKRVRKSVGRDKREAEIYYQELKYRLFRGDIQPDRPKIPVEYVIDKYLDDCKKRIAPSPQIRYRNALCYFREFVTVYSPVQHIDQITKIMLSEYVDFRMGKSKKPKGNTVNQELTIIRAMLNFAMDSEYIDKNPARRIKMLKTNDAKKGQIINEEEVRSLINGCDQIKEGRLFRDVLLVLLNTGMRLGELINLTWTDVDMDEMVIKVQEKPGWKPKSGTRDIPVNHTVKSVLVSLGERPRGIHVFTRDGKKIEQNVPRKMLIKVAKRVGLSHITRIHDLRHTFASNLLMKGVDIPTVQALLGHKSWSTTMIYSHQTKKHNRRAIEILD